MSKRKFFITHYIAMTSILMLIPGLIYGALFAEYFDYMSKNPIYLGIFVCFCFNLLFSIGFFIWVSKTKQGKIYDKMQVEYQQSKIDKQIMPEIVGTEYYATLPVYKGSESFTIYKNVWKKRKNSIRMFFAVLIITVAFIAIYYVFNDNAIFIFIEPEFYMILLLLAIAGLNALSNIYTRKYRFDEVTVDGYGVTLLSKKDGKTHKRIFKWDQIKGIAISTTNAHYRTDNSYIYFKKKEIKGDRCIPEYSDKPHTIMLKYRPEAIHCILQYWGEKIHNLEAMKSWKKYIDTL